MTYLLDTQLVFWITFESHRLPLKARTIIDGSDPIAFSVINLWEIVIKTGRPRSEFRFDARPMRRALLSVGYTELPVLAHHAFAVAELPPIHADPFDRLMIAQARSEGLTLLTTDATVASYGSNIQRI